MTFAQLTWCESLRGIEVTLRAKASKLYPMVFRHSVNSTTVAEAND